MEAGDIWSTGNISRQVVRRGSGLSFSRDVFEGFLVQNPDPPGRTKIQQALGLPFSCDTDRAFDGRQGEAGKDGPGDFQDRKNVRVAYGSFLHREGKKAHRNS